MFTDIYFTNSAPLSSPARVAISQKDIALTRSSGTIFKVIEKCQHGWSHVVRIPWDLNFRLVKSSGNITPPYYLKTTYKSENKKFLIWKNGTITVQQNYGNGKQIIDFEQIKGNGFCSVQFYRGEFLIGELYFTGKHITFQIDNNITIIENYVPNKMGTVAGNAQSAAFDFDLSGIRALHLSIDKTNKLIVHKTEQW